MINKSLVEALAFTVPIVCALVCMIMMLMDAGVRKNNRQEKRLRIFLATTYLVTSLGWLGMVFYAVSPRIFTYYYTVFLLTMMLDQVMIYRFVSVITSTGEQRKFNRLHLIIPLLCIAVSVIRDMTVLLFIVYNTLYPILNLRNIRRYRQFIVNYSSDVYNTSLGWLAVIQAFILVTVPIPLAGLLSGISSFSSGYIVWLGALPYFINYLILCYNLLNDNYLIIQPDDTKEEVSVKSTTLELKRFERYLREKKPYLDPNLRITDLARGLNTNRSYLSTFINKEYNMNFCRLINRCRLHELERIRLLSSNSDKTNIELVLMAGFSNYRSYLRVKQEEDKLALLKVFER